MSTIDVSNSMAPLDRWSPTGRGDARAMQRSTAHSPPRSWLSLTPIGTATRPNALTHSRGRQRAGLHPITATQADAAKSP